MRTLIAIAACATFTGNMSVALDAYSKAGAWQGLLDDEACTIWTATEEGPNASLWFRKLPDLGLEISMKTTAWIDARKTPFRPGADGYSQAYIFNLPIDNMSALDVIAFDFEGTASLVEKHRPQQYAAVVDTIRRAAASATDFGIIDDANYPVGRFSSDGFPDMFKKFEECLAGKP